MGQEEFVLDRAAAHAIGLRDAHHPLQTGGTVKEEDQKCAMMYKVTVFKLRNSF